MWNGTTLHGYTHLAPRNYLKTLLVYLGHLCNRTKTTWGQIKITARELNSLVNDAWSLYLHRDSQPEKMQFFSNCLWNGLWSWYFHTAINSLPDDIRALWDLLPFHNTCKAEMFQLAFGWNFIGYIKSGMLLPSPHFIMEGYIYCTTSVIICDFCSYVLKWIFRDYYFSSYTLPWAWKLGRAT